MKKFITYSFLIGALISGTVASAQEGETKAGTQLSVGVEVGIPSGDFGESHKLGLGGSAKVAIPVFTDGAFTVSAGYLSFSGKEMTISGITFKNAAANLIPLKAGLRYSFPTAGGFYLEPQLGYTIFSGSGNSSGAFTYAANVGMLINNMVDVAARYEAASKNGATLSHIGLRLAYAFSLGAK
jgi:hypothetical protein